MIHLSDAEDVKKSIILAANIIKTQRFDGGKEDFDSSYGAGNSKDRNAKVGVNYGVKTKLIQINLNHSRVAQDLHS